MSFEEVDFTDNSSYQANPIHDNNSKEEVLKIDISKDVLDELLKESNTESYRYPQHFKNLIEKWNNDESKVHKLSENEFCELIKMFEKEWDLTNKLNGHFFQVPLSNSKYMKKDNESDTDEIISPREYIKQKNYSKNVFNDKVNKAKKLYETVCKEDIDKIEEKEKEKEDKKNISDINFDNYNFPSVVSNLLKSIKHDDKTMKLFSEYGKKINEALNNDPDKYILKNYSKGLKETDGLIDDLMQKLSETLVENPDLSSTFINFSKEVSDKYNKDTEFMNIFEDPSLSKEYFQKCFLNGFNYGSTNINMDFKSLYPSTIDYMKANPSLEDIMKLDKEEQNNKKSYNKYSVLPEDKGIDDIINEYNGEPSEMKDFINDVIKKTKDALGENSIKNNNFTEYVTQLQGYNKKYPKNMTDINHNIIKDEMQHVKFATEQYKKMNDILEDLNYNKDLETDYTKEATESIKNKLKNDDIEHSEYIKKFGESLKNMPVFDNTHIDFYNSNLSPNSEVISGHSNYSKINLPIEFYYSSDPNNNIYTTVKLEDNIGGSLPNKMYFVSNVPPNVTASVNNNISASQDKMYFVSNVPPSTNSSSNELSNKPLEIYAQTFNFIKI